MGIQVVVYEENRVVRKISVVDQLVVGRGSECTLQLHDNSVSTKHARIFREGDGFVVEDLGSHNKTLVEGGPILSKSQRAPLRPGMKLFLGRIKLGIEGELGVRVAPLPASLDQTAQLMDNTLQLEPAAPSSDEEAESSDGAAEADSGEATLVPSSHKPAPIPKLGPGQSNLPPDSGTIVPLPPDSKIAAHAFQEGLQPKLVFDNDAFRKCVKLAGETTIGRNKGTLTINHPLLSSPHARIFYDARSQRLFLEDLQSKNNTFLNGEVLSANMPREIPLQAHLRFGTIDALFVMDKDYDGETLAEQRALAVELLVSSKRLDPARRKKAEAEATSQSLPLEAGLILTGALTVPQWVKVFEDARIAHVTRGFTSQHTRTLKLWIGGLVLAFLALLALFIVKFLRA